MEDETKQGQSVLKTAIIGFIAGMVATVIVLGAQHYILPPKADAVMTVDLKQLINQKRSAIIDKYKGAYTDENAKKAETEIKQFTEDLQEGIQSTSGGRPVFLKDVVLGESVDITDQLMKYVNEGSVESKNEKSNKK